MSTNNLAPEFKVISFPMPLVNIAPSYWHIPLVMLLPDTDTFHLLCCSRILTHSTCYVAPGYWHIPLMFLPDTGTFHVLCCSQILTHSTCYVAPKYWHIPLVMLLTNTDTFYLLCSSQIVTHSTFSIVSPLTSFIMWLSLSHNVLRMFAAAILSLLDRRITVLWSNWATNSKSSA